MAASRIERAVLHLAARLRRGRPDAWSSVALTIPVFLLYHLGILWSRARNGVDWVTELTLRLVHFSLPAYALATLLAAALLMSVTFALRAAGKSRRFAWPSVAAESALWALLMLLGVGWAAAHVTPALASARAGALSPFERVVMAAGAGFHEEAVFRVALLSGGAFGLRRVFGLREVGAFTLAAASSSVLFALAHHVGPDGEALSLHALCFRTLAGLFLALVYGARGFAVAVYTHAFYDLMVFFLLG